VNAEAASLWDRALKAFSSAEALVATDPDGAASRAYYSAFYAASALFALEGKTFTKHTALAAAVHRDLVRTGRWPSELGEAFSWLLRTRQTGDYGQDLRVKPEEARAAAEKASLILEAVHKAMPGSMR
jgi:uncharacterized protein (UPF0332 family)